ncbi:tRNA pseudouridine(38-40) synthase TruA [Anaerotalea alkaliphila]|uniref:tRNA pseudouridine synthase A n=1 Tax=Anaerotalea alkaliphila TaxID=2662126 RepID=A0A7X5KP04_9FIRM|nr:tRNA pseudouridine(38-40) synthase TruA [Anaerotalea alkaliphila]
MKNYKCVVAYDGRRYKGFRKVKQSGDDQTIQGKLEGVLRKRFEKDIEVLSAVNTDAGVHATHQVVNFKLDTDDYSGPEIKEYFETYLPEDIVMRSAEIVDDRFHSRYNVQSVTYTYRLWKSNAAERPLFERQLVNVMTQRLNVGKMRAGAELFLGEHDFAAFSTKSKTNSTVKTILDLAVEETENEVVVKIEANGFLLNMERIIVGTLIQVGFGDRDVKSVTKAFESKDRKDAGHKVMSHALCLTDVKY